MEMKFDLTVANWLAYLADPSISIATLGHTVVEKSMLKLIFNKLIESNLYSLNESQEALDGLKILQSRLDTLPDEQRLDDFYFPLREYLLKKQWMALIIPSGIEADLDNILCDPELLGYVVRSKQNEQGLVLQLDETPNSTLTVLDRHRVLGTALNESIDWPGILIWSPGGDAIFLPVSSVGFLEIDIEARVQWVFSKLFSESSFDLSRFRVEYKQAFAEVFENEAKSVNILHLSDLNIGNNESSHRMLCVQHHIRSLVEDLGEVTKIIPVITGNFMNNPSDKHIHLVRSFWGFLSGMGTEAPLLVFGNNDVRKDGNINESYRNAIGFQNTKVTWYEEENIAIISLNTVVHGNLKQGAVGVEQLEAIEYEIDRKKGSADYRFVIMLHHLPISSDGHNDSMQSFYDKIIGGDVEGVSAIKGADVLIGFINKFSVTVLLHGHLQVPLMGEIGANIPVVGCGRSTGIRSKTDGSVYFSMNIISINLISKKLVARFLAIRKPENGLFESKRHEVLFRGLL